MARCRRNVDNFLEACRKIGVDEVIILSLLLFTFGFPFTLKNFIAFPLKLNFSLKVFPSEINLALTLKSSFSYASLSKNIYAKQ